MAGSNCSHLVSEWIISRYSDDCSVLASEAWLELLKVIASTHIASDVLCFQVPASIACSTLEGIQFLFRPAEFLELYWCRAHASKRSSTFLCNCAYPVRSMQVSFHGPNVASTAMQLFRGQATRLKCAMQEGTLSIAQFCSFFTLLGAMPQCLRVEADAILAMIRSARETDQENGDEARPEGERWTVSCLGHCMHCFSAVCVRKLLSSISLNKSFDWIAQGAISQAHFVRGAQKPATSSRKFMYVSYPAGFAANAGFNYMQKAETMRMDEAAVASCMKKLLADFEPCQCMPLLLKAAAECQTPEIQVLWSVFVLP